MRLLILVLEPGFRDCLFLKMKPHNSQQTSGNRRLSVWMSQLLILHCVPVSDHPHCIRSLIHNDEGRVFTAYQQNSHGISRARQEDKLPVIYIASRQGNRWNASEHLSIELSRSHPSMANFITYSCHSLNCTRKVRTKRYCFPSIFFRCFFPELKHLPSRSASHGRHMRR